MKTIDWTKPLQHVDGRSARLLGVIEPNHSNTHVVAMSSMAGDVVSLVSTSGRYGESGSQVVVNAPEKVTLWLNVYEVGLGGVYASSSWPSKSDADRNAHTDRIGEARKVEIEL